MLEHISDIFLVCEGYINSALCVIIGISGTAKIILNPPQKKYPNARIIKLFGKKKLGPIKKFEIPHNSMPIVTQT